MPQAIISASVAHVAVATVFLPIARTIMNYCPVEAGVCVVHLPQAKVDKDKLFEGGQDVVETWPLPQNFGK